MQTHASETYNSVTWPASLQVTPLQVELPPLPPAVPLPHGSELSAQGRPGPARHAGSSSAVRQLLQALGTSSNRAAAQVEVWEESWRACTPSGGSCGAAQLPRGPRALRLSAERAASRLPGTLRRQLWLREAAGALAAHGAHPPLRASELQPGPPPLPASPTEASLSFSCLLRRCHARRYGAFVQQRQERLWRSQAGLECWR